MNPAPITFRFAFNPTGYPFSFRARAMPTPHFLPDMKQVWEVMLRVGDHGPIVTWLVPTRFARDDVTEQHVLDWIGDLFGNAVYAGHSPEVYAELFGLSFAQATRDVAYCRYCAELLAPMGFSTMAIEDVAHFLEHQRHAVEVTVL